MTEKILSYSLRLVSVCIAVYIPISVIYAAESTGAAKSLELHANKLVTNADFDAEKVLVRYKGEKNFRAIFLGEYSAQEKEKFAEKFNVAEVDSERVRIKSKLKELLADPSVEVAQPNYIYTTQAWTSDATTAKPSDYDESRHWYYTAAKLKEMWKDQGCPSDPACGGSPDVVVAVIDTGLAFEAFNDSTGFTGDTFPGSVEYSSGINLYSNPDEIADNGLDDDCNGVVDDKNGIDSFAVILLGEATCTNDVPDAMGQNYRKGGHPNDNYGHGSLVTGHIASNVDNSAGSASPAFKTTIMPIAANIYYTNSFSTESIIRGLQYATAQGADIVNMSLGGGSDDTLFKSAIHEAYTAGVLLIAASGNTGSSNPVYPAFYPEVLAVGAVNANNTKTGYTSYGNWLDIAAYVGAGPLSPGTAIWQTTLGCYSGCTSINITGGTSEKHSIGTSFAAPQVTALAALIKSKYPSYTNEEIVELIQRTATDVGAVGYDNQTGAGIINFQLALSMVLPNSRKIYRFWSDAYAAHFYTLSKYERDSILYTYPSSTWRFEAEGFSGVKLTSCDSSGAKRVYRFWSDAYQNHFYTISETEKNNVINNYPDEIWRYEIEAYCAFTSQQPGTLPIYRFWSDTYNSHFYTISETEKNNIIANFPTKVWRLETIAYYTYP